MRSDNSLRYISYKWPARSVERLPPYTAATLKNPVLVIGNPDRPAAKFAVWDKTTLFLDIDSLNFEIEFDRPTKRARDPDLLTLGHGDVDEKGRVRMRLDSGR